MRYTCGEWAPPYEQNAAPEGAAWGSERLCYNSVFSFRRIRSVGVLNRRSIVGDEAVHPERDEGQTVALGLGQRFRVLPPVVRHAIRCHDRPRAVGAAAAVHK